MRRLLAAITILLIGMPCICWGDGACTTAMPFLKIGMGVRASAMGKAFCAVADDSSAVYYNPAGLGQIKRGQISLEHTRWFEDVGYTCVSGVYPLKTMSIGGFANMLLTDEMQTTTEAQPQGTGETFREIDGIFGVSCGINLTDHISVGATGKICSQRIGDKGAVGFANDMGFLCKTKHVGLGLALQNIGTDIKFIDKGFALPVTIRTGIAWTNSWFTISGGMTNILPEKRRLLVLGLRD
ncbi:MAG: PorV/PorQ family protein [Candidatus Desantisbacteria bacterium]